MYCLKMQSSKTHLDLVKPSIRFRTNLVWGRLARLITWAYGLITNICHNGMEESGCVFVHFHAVSATLFVRLFATLFARDAILRFCPPVHFGRWLLLCFSPSSVCLSAASSGVGWYHWGTTSSSSSSRSSRSSSRCRSSSRRISSLFDCHQVCKDRHADCASVYYCALLHHRNYLNKYFVLSLWTQVLLLLSDVCVISSLQGPSLRVCKVQKSLNSPTDLVQKSNNITGI